MGSMQTRIRYLILFTGYKSIGEGQFFLRFSGNISKKSANKQQKNATKGHSTLPLISRITKVPILAFLSLIFRQSYGDKLLG